MLTINISPTVLFGGELYCYKEGEIEYAYTNNLVRVYKHNLFGDFNDKDFKYFTKASLKSLESNPDGFKSSLNVWTPGEDDDNEYVACGSLDLSSTWESIYTYSETGENEGGNSSQKILAIILIEGSYSSEQVDPQKLQEMDAIVDYLLKTSD
jgi:hypothetical protein